MIKCLCCGKRIKKTKYNRIFCTECAEYHKRKDNGLTHRNSRLKKENDDLKRSLGKYE